MAGPILRELCITKACPGFLSSSHKILVVAATETTRVIAYLYRLEEHELQCDSSHCWLT